jgi:hypothetical protein
MSLIASIDPATLQVEPGGQSIVVVRVRNRGTIVERFEIGVVGPAAAWAHAEPDALRLFPDVEGTAQVIFHPPKAASPHADTYPFGISIRPAADPDSSTVEEGRVTVAPFVELLTEIVPQTSRGSRSGRHTVTIKNEGNAVAEIALTATDPDRLLMIEVEPQRLGLEAGGSRAVRTRVKPAGTFFTGPPNRIPFVVQVDERMSGSRQIPASFEQRPILPGWLKPVVGLGVAGVLALLVLPRILGLTGNDGPTPTDPPNSTPAAQSAPATPAALETPSASQAAPTQTPEPTPGELLIVVTGDANELQGGLSLSCLATDQACRDRAENLIELIMRDLLLGPYEGGGLVSVGDIAPGTLPVVGTWPGQFQYKAEGRTVVGLTRKIAIDLAPLFAQTPEGTPGFAYAVVEDSADGTHRYVIPSATAMQLKNMLYEVPPEMEPDATPPPDPCPRCEVLNEGLIRPELYRVRPTTNP